MRIAILGAGIVGTAAAATLAQRGYDITLMDEADIAQKTSFANGAHLSEGDTETWLTRKNLLKITLRNALPHPPIKVRPTLDPNLWRFLGAVIRHAHKRPHDILPQMARENAKIMRDSRVPDHIYHRQSEGVLQIFRKKSALNRALKRREGLARQTLTPQQCADIAPGLNVKRLVGGVLFPEDATGDAHLFARHLARHAEQNGATILTHRAATGLILKNGRAQAVLSDKGAIDTDCVILALGDKTGPFAREHLGIRIPITPAAGYSITVPLIKDAPAPKVGVTDPEARIVISRLEDSLRIAGLVDIGRHAILPDPRRMKQLLGFLRGTLPAAADMDKVSFWRGFRPMTPDGLPLIGALPLYENIYINAGHGHLGWTLALVSARILRELIEGEAEAPFARYLSPLRFIRGAPENSPASNATSAKRHKSDRVEIAPQDRGARLPRAR